MRQAVTWMMVCLTLAVSPVEQARAGGADAAGTIAQARRLIEAQDYSPAIVLLEDLLPDADAQHKPAILELLRQSYVVIAHEAQAAGRDRDARYYQDNLAIIERRRPPAAAAKPIEQKPRKPAAPQTVDGGSKTSSALGSPPSRPSAPHVSLLRAAQDPPPAPLPVPAPMAEPAKLPMPEPLPQLPKDLALPSASLSSLASEPSSPARTTDDPGRDDRDNSSVPQRSAEVPLSTGPAPATAHAGAAQPGASKPRPAEPSLREGDRLFAAGRYDDAGRCYASLASQNRLPAHRKEHWAYCRMVDVARRINARPKSGREWDNIEAEIVLIQKLTPSIWYGEYLRNKVAEVRRNGRRSRAQSENLVVRGSAPDESRGPQEEPQSRRLPRLFGKSRADTPAQPQGPDKPAAASAEAPLILPGATQPPDPVAQVSQPTVDADVRRTEADGAPASGVAWQVVETPNFRVYHQDARLAEAAGQAAESVRAAQAKRWGSPAEQRPWTPPCDIYLYPTGKVFARETNQPENSPGFSTMMCNGDRVVARRTNLRADHPQLLTAILPHEVTHVVLADLFTVQQVPRWADEGVAVLAEPRAEQQIRAAELQEPLDAGRIFELSKLMAMDYPDARDWGLYYAQSVSLTRFLVEQGPPQRFIQFVRDSQRDGIEGALRGTYRIAGFAELQKRWLEYARRQFTPLAEARRDPDSQAPATEVN